MANYEASKDLDLYTQFNITRSIYVHYNKKKSRIYQNENNEIGEFNNKNEFVIKCNK